MINSSFFDVVCLFNMFKSWGTFELEKLCFESRKMDCKEEANHGTWLRTLKEGDRVDLRLVRYTSEYSYGGNTKKCRLGIVTKVDTSKDLIRVASCTANKQRLDNVAFWVNSSTLQASKSKTDMIPIYQSINHLRPLGTSTTRHVEDCIMCYSPDCLTRQCQMCDRECCSRCSIVFIKSIENQMKYLCPDCECPRRYKEFYLVAKAMHVLSKKNDHIEMNIIDLIAVYSKEDKYGLYCYNVTCKSVVKIDSNVEYSHINGIEHFPINGVICQSCDLLNACGY